MIAIADLVPGVRATSDNLVFEVQSASRPRIWHRVDLAATSGFGGCSCERYTMTLQKRVRKAAIPTAALECGHIREARRYLAIQVAQAMIRLRLNNPDPRMSRRDWENPGC